MKNIYKLSAVAGVVAMAGMAGCGSGSNSDLSSAPTNINSVPNPNTGTGTNLSVDNRTFVQQERLARPLVNEVFATVANNRHSINNRINPTEDPREIANDIESFLTFPAERSRQVKDVIKSVLVPDVMIADLSRGGAASYLGVETNGATGGTFGGRKLQDDVVDISLGIIFGNTISALGLAPDDGKVKPPFTTDNVGAGAKNFTATFPYLGSPK